MKSDQELSRLLVESKPACAVPPDFQAQVWQKISLRADERRSEGLAGFWARIFGGLLEPRYGYSAALCVVLAGFALGQVQASADLRKAWSSLENRYVSSIDPYAQSGHGKHP